MSYPEDYFSNPCLFAVQMVFFKGDPNMVYFAASYKRVWLSQVDATIVCELLLQTYF